MAGGGSSLKYHDKLSARNREVYLDGEAFFDVKKDNGRTFQVVTELVEVKVLGTRFDVRVSEEDNMAEVVLESGSVKLNERNKAEDGVILRPGKWGVSAGNPVLRSAMSTFNSILRGKINI